MFSNPCVSLLHVDRTAAGSPVKALDDHNDISAPGSFSGSATASATGSASVLQCGTTVNMTNVEFLNVLFSLGLRLSKKIITVLSLSLKSESIIFNLLLTLLDRTVGPLLAK